MRTLIAMAAILGFGTLVTAASAQNAADATGNWALTTTGEAFTAGAVKLVQSGAALSGTYGRAGHLQGSFQAGSRQADANWYDGRGSGWMTIVFSPDGDSFSGQWGYPARKPSGYFSGRRIAPVFPPVTGDFSVSENGGPEFAMRHLTLRQLGQTVVGNFGPGTQISGTMSTDTGNTLKGTWKDSQGDGWVNLQFASDSRSFQGEWGLTADAQARGRILGTIISHEQMYVQGQFDVASSGRVFSSGLLKLRQQGQTVIGTFKHGHLQGTLPPGSSVLTGRFRDSHGTGTFSLTFDGNGKGFEGTWKRSNGTEGRVIGKRVIAASPALRQ